MLVASPIAKTDVPFAIVITLPVFYILGSNFSTVSYMSLCERLGELEGGEVISQKACGRKSCIYIYI